MVRNKDSKIGAQDGAAYIEIHITCSPRAWTVSKIGMVEEWHVTVLVLSSPPSNLTTISLWVKGNWMSFVKDARHDQTGSS